MERIVPTASTYVIFVHELYMLGIPIVLAPFHNYVLC